MVLRERVELSFTAYQASVLATELSEYGVDKVLGLEPRFNPSKGFVLPLDDTLVFVVGITGLEPATSCTLTILIYIPLFSYYNN